jgi:hypothetical protein
MTQAGLGKSFAPKNVLSKLPALYSTDGDGAIEDKPLIAKWFSPYNGWTWYAAECDPETRECFGFIVGHEQEWGSFNLNELQSLTGMGGRLPLVERDHYFTPTTLRELKQKGRVAA